MGYRQVFGDAGLGDLNGSVKTLVGASLGEVRYSDDGKKKYRLFYNASGASIPIGGVFAKDAAGAGLYSAVTGTTETGATFAIGCNDSTKTVMTATYFWGCVEGHPVSLLASNISVGTDIPVMMADDFKVIPATVPTYTPFAINMGDSDTAGVGTNTSDTASGRYDVYFEQAYRDTGKQIA
jgi:hypothetical protein